MARSLSKPFHRMSRRKQRRKETRRRVLWAAVLLSILWAFAAGYLWRQWSVKSFAAEQTMQQATPQQRAEAMRLLDRAIEAKHGELLGEALRLADEARQIDPQTPGLAVFIAEMALSQGQIDAVAAAARAGLQLPGSTARPKLLLALEAWMRRGQTGPAEAGERATQWLSEAGGDELANSSVRFFAGDLFRSTGRPAEAQANLLASLYRQQPWDSATLLATKLWLALEEAGPTANLRTTAATGREGKIYGATAVRLQRVIQSSGDVAPAVAALQTIFSTKQTAELLSDPALAHALLNSVQLTVGTLLPHAESKSLHDNEAPPPEENAER